jgi:3-methylcrotonyl-CoA carboxylase alpha subunit
VVEIGSGERRRFRITACGKSVMASGELKGNELYADIDGHRQRVVVVPHDRQFTLFSQRGAMQFALAQPDYGEDSAQPAADAFLAPMPGVIVKLLVEPGAPVEQGQPLLIMEAMKMEHRVCAPGAGVVKSFCFQPGEQVAGGDELLEFLPTVDDPQGRIQP